MLGVQSAILFFFVQKELWPTFPTQWSSESNRFVVVVRIVTSDLSVIWARRCMCVRNVGAISIPVSQLTVHAVLQEDGHTPLHNRKN